MKHRSVSKVRSTKSSKVSRRIVSGNSGNFSSAMEDKNPLAKLKGKIKEVTNLNVQWDSTSQGTYVRKLHGDLK